MKKTPLESWILHKIVPHGANLLTRSLLETYQLRKLREVFAYVKEHSFFYRKLLSETPEASLTGLEGISRLPFTYPRDLVEMNLQMLCVSQDEIARVVTLNTSGTTGESKRNYFTEEDLELTIDFFMHGMSTLVESGETVIIFLPGQKPNSVGDLLAKALQRMRVRAVVHGPISDPAAAREEILRCPAVSLVGIPSQILSVARSDVMSAIPEGWVNSVLLSTDYVPMAIIGELERLWGCKVYSHYGMTEMGLGGGVECDARAGYHLREADLYVEVVDSSTGRPLQAGEYGEVVFSTLTRKGMPLLRYRTGDLARFLPNPCPCGTALKRLDRVQGRIGGEIPLRQGLRLAIRDLDEALFPMDGVLNYTAVITEAEGKDYLHLSFHTVDGKEQQVSKTAEETLRNAHPVRHLFERQALTLGSITFSSQDWFTTGVKKRKIVDRRSQGGNNRERAS